MRLALLLVWPSLMPVMGFAQTDCPAAADLATGIVVTYDNGSTDVFRTDPADSNYVIVETVIDQEPVYRTILMRGVYIASFTTLPETDANAIGGEIVFSVAASDAVLPSPGGSWRVSVNGYGEPGEDVMFDHAFAEAVPTTIGDCTYETILVKLTNNYGGGEYQTLNYIPELGFGYDVAAGYNDVVMETKVPLTITRLD